MSHEADHARVPPLAIEDPPFAKHMELVRPVTPDDGSEGKRSRVVFAPVNLTQHNRQDRNVTVSFSKRLQRILIAVEINFRSFS